MKFIDNVLMAGFIVVMLYVTFWFYADTYCRLANGENVKPFAYQLSQAICFNLAVYVVLMVITPF